MSDTFAGIEAAVVNKIDKSSFISYWGVLAINKVKIDGVSQGAKCHGVNEAEGRRLGEKRSL